MTMISAEQAIYELLKNLAGGKVYDNRGKQGDTTFIVIQRRGSERWRHLRGPAGWAQADIIIDAYAPTARERKDLALQIEDLLDGFDGNVTIPGDSPQQIVNIGFSLQDDLDTIDQTAEPFLYRNSATYLATYKTEDQNV